MSLSNYRWQHFSCVAVDNTDYSSNVSLDVKVSRSCCASDQPGVTHGEDKGSRQKDHRLVSRNHDHTHYSSYSNPNIGERPEHPVTRAQAPRPSGQTVRAPFHLWTCEKVARDLRRV